MMNLRYLFSTLLLTSAMLLMGQQTYYGTTASGGSFDLGTIYSIDDNGNHVVGHEMVRLEGSLPKSDLEQAPNGKFYGVTQFGGEFGQGVLFEYDPVTDTYTVRYSFNGASDGGQPVRGVTRARNGRLYGLCSTGGANNAGTLFEFIIGTGAYSVRVDFGGNGPGTIGGRPIAKLEPNSTASILYGTTQFGGANGRGTVFSYGTIPTSGPGPTVSGHTVMHDFVGPGATSTGINPVTGVTRSGGTLYGVTPSGGPNGSGAFYSVSTSSPFTQTVIRSFTSTDADGRTPQGEPVVAGGVIYGTTSVGGTTGGGKIFSYDPNTTTFTAVHGFSNPDGVQSLSGMRTGADGKLYGACRSGGTTNGGTLFRFDPVGAVFEKLADMAGSGLSAPEARLTESPFGTFYGTCSTGGSGLVGALYRLETSGPSLTSMVPFGFSPASIPTGRMAHGPGGVLIGFATNGGTNASGVIYSFDPGTSQFSVLHDLSFADGRFPQGEPLVIGNTVYGLASTGGALSGGTLFSFDLISSTLTVLEDLGGLLGSGPVAGLVVGPDGALYGTCSDGGSNGLGVIFRYDLSGSSYSVVHSFSGNEGNDPTCTPVLSGGQLYGTCAAGGNANGDGTLWRYDAGGGGFQLTQQFNDLVSGSGPGGDLLLASDGILYGTAASGGFQLDGAIYGYDPVQDTLGLVYSFTAASQGSAPRGALIEDASGRLLGTCAEGGTTGDGSVFRLTIGSGTLNVLHDMDGATGSLPLDGLVAPAVPVAGVQLGLKAFLDGPYDSGSQLMSDDLRSLGGFPIAEPYTSAGFTHVGGGGETIVPAVLAVSGNNAIVDWVFVELRSGSDISAVVATRSALIQRDGDVVDVDGTSPVSFSGVASGSYHVALRHRNHLGVATLSPLSFGTGTTTVDLSLPATGTFGTEAQRNNSGVMALWSGNVIGDALVKYTGGGNDRDPILTVIGGTVPTATTSGYLDTDVNMDGVVKYTGGSNDRDRILQTIGGVVPTATRVEQLP